MIDPMRFCLLDPEYTDHPLAMPFIRKGYLYATDGIYAIRLPTDKPDSEDNASKARPHIETLPLWNQTPSKYEPLPAIDPPILKPCPVCVGNLPTKCAACDGFGEVNYTFEYKSNNYEHPADCPLCEECGEITYCDECDNRGILTEITRIRIQGADYEAWRLVDLKHLPNLVAGTVSGPALRFTFDGGDGILMGLRDR